MLIKHYTDLMATNKESIDSLEVGLSGLQNGMQQIEIGIIDKLHQLEQTINRMSEALLSNKQGSNHNIGNCSHSYKKNTKDGAIGRRMIFSL